MNAQHGFPGVGNRRQPARSSSFQKLNDAVVTALEPSAKKLLASKAFQYASLSFLLNPILLGMQLRHALTAPDVLGLSSLTFGGFALLNLLTALAGIKARSAPMFSAFAASFLLSSAIAGVVMFR